MVMCEYIYEQVQIYMDVFLYLHMNTDIQAYNYTDSKILVLKAKYILETL